MAEKGIKVKCIKIYDKIEINSVTNYFRDIKTGASKHVVVLYWSLNLAQGDHYVGTLSYINALYGSFHKKSTSF